MNKTCPSCGANYNISQQHVGRSLTCQKCNSQLTVAASGLVLANAGSAAPISASPKQSFSELDDDFDDVPVSSSRRKRRSGSSSDSSSFYEFITFRRMIATTVIQVLFWLGIAGCVIYGIICLIGGFAMMFSGGGRGNAGVFGGLLAIGGALFFFLIAPFIVRLQCEILIVIFRIHDSLRELNENMRR